MPRTTIVTYRVGVFRRVVSAMSPENVMATGGNTPLGVRILVGRSVRGSNFSRKFSTVPRSRIRDE